MTSATRAYGKEHTAWVESLPAAEIRFHGNGLRHGAVWVIAGSARGYWKWKRWVHVRSWRKAMQEAADGAPAMIARALGRGALFVRAVISVH